MFRTLSRLRRPSPSHSRHCRISIAPDRYCERKYVPGLCLGRSDKSNRRRICRDGTRNRRGNIGCARCSNDNSDRAYCPCSLLACISRLLLVRPRYRVRSWCKGAEYFVLITPRKSPYRRAQASNMAPFGLVVARQGSPRWAGWQSRLCCYRRCSVSDFGSRLYI